MFVRLSEGRVPVHAGVSLWVQHVGVAEQQVAAHVLLPARRVFMPMSAVLPLRLQPVADCTRCALCVWLSRRRVPLSAAVLVRV